MCERGDFPRAVEIESINGTGLDLKALLDAGIIERASDDNLFRPGQQGLRLVDGNGFERIGRLEAIQGLKAAIDSIREVTTPSGTGIRSVWLFGSALFGGDGSCSDVDAAVGFGRLSPVLSGDAFSSICHEEACVGLLTRDNPRISAASQTEIAMLAHSKGAAGFPVARVFFNPKLAFHDCGDEEAVLLRCQADFLSRHKTPHLAAFGICAAEALADGVKKPRKRPSC